jgi:hypothetical protein
MSERASWAPAGLAAAVVVLGLVISRFIPRGEGE